MYPVLISIRVAKSSPYLWIFFYSLIFFAIRILASQFAMTPDEAEQFIDASKYFMLYPDQPPLYSWILKTLSFFFGLNVPMMIVVFHILACLFLIILYKAVRLVWDEQRSMIVFLSTALFFIFSYDFYRYTIHTALMMVFVALALYAYIMLHRSARLKYYLVLAIAFALGFLSKYNFLFFVYVMILASLSTTYGRVILFHRNSLVAISIMAILLLPHLSSVFANDGEPFRYALSRAESGFQGFSLQEVFLNTYWNYLLYIFVMIGFFGYKLSKGDNHLMASLRIAGVLAFLVPLLLILVLKTGNFSQRWLAPLNLYIVFALSSFFDFELKNLRSKLFYALIFLIIFSIYLIRFGVYFYPDYFGRTFIHKPYAKVLNNIEAKLIEQGYDLRELELLVYKEHEIYAAIKSLHPRLKISYSNNYPMLKPKQVLVWTSDNKTLRTLDYFLLVESPYLRSRGKDKYKVYFTKFMIKNS